MEHPQIATLTNYNFFTINEGTQWIWLWSLTYTYYNKRGELKKKEYIDLIPDGSSITYNNPQNKIIKVDNIISVRFMWNGKGKTILNDNAKNLDKNSDCIININCIIPSNYDGTNLDVITCTSQ